MNTVFFKTLLACLLSLIFVGQSIASVAMVYKMTSMQAMQMSATEQKGDHQSAAMSHCDEMTMAYATTKVTAANTTDSTLQNSSDKNHTDNEKCCVQDCQCLTGACSIASAIFSMRYYDTTPTNSTKILTNVSVVLTRTAQSLYRPPIQA